ncbi:MAG: hypothetical protein E7618_05880, partial [Ruminococcaceae bacterium]|nr:hypothetical protein [Oscillospiraceae bacterium]
MRIDWIEAMSGISDIYVAECEGVQKGGIASKPQKKEAPRLLVTLSYVALMAVMLAVILVGPALLRRQPTGEPTKYTAVDTVEKIRYGMPFSEVAQLLGENYTVENYHTEGACIRYQYEDIRLELTLNTAFFPYSGGPSCDGDGYLSFPVRAIMFTSEAEPTVSGQLYCDKNGYFALPDAIERDPDRFFDRSQMEAITDRMAWHEAVTLLGSEGVRIGSAVYHISYQLNDGELFVFSLHPVDLRITALAKESEPEKPEDPQLSAFPLDDLIAQIEADYLAYHIEHSRFDPTKNPPLTVGAYYGIYDGAVAVMMQGFDHADVYMDSVVAGSVIHYGDSNTILLWKDGVFYELVEAYEKGLLSSDNAAAIAALHNTGSWFTKADLERVKTLLALPDLDDRDDIKSAFDKRGWMAPVWRVPPYLGGTLCYGQFGAVTVLFEANQLGYEETKTIAGIEFTYASGFNLW